MSSMITPASVILLLVLAATGVNAEDTGSITGFPAGVFYNYDVAGSSLDTSSSWHADGYVSEEDAQAVIDHLNLGLSYNILMDVNLDSSITALDALLIINVLNSNPWQNYTSDNTDRYDVNNSNGSGKVTALDALVIINELNARSSELQPLKFK